MIVDGVNFIVHVCSQMSKDEFIQKHIDHVWPEKDKKKRKQMLADTYDIINPPKEEKKPETESN